MTPYLHFHHGFTALKKLVLTKPCTVVAIAKNKAVQALRTGDLNGYIYK